MWNASGPTAEYIRREANIDCNEKIASNCRNTPSNEWLFEEGHSVVFESQFQLIHVDCGLCDNFLLIQNSHASHCLLNEIQINPFCFIRLSHIKLSSPPRNIFSAHADWFMAIFGMVFHATKMMRSDFIYLCVSWRFKCNSTWYSTEFYFAYVPMRIDATYFSWVWWPIC